MVVIRITEAERLYVAGVHRTHDERWSTFCATIEDRIKEVRAEQTDAICGTCGSTTPEIRDRKWCSRGQHPVDIKHFARDRSRRDGRRPNCKTCDADQAKAYRKKIALDGARRSA